MRKRVLILTGNLGIGKTTVLMKTFNALKERGYTVDAQTIIGVVEKYDGVAIEEI